MSCPNSQCGCFQAPPWIVSAHTIYAFSASFFLYKLRAWPTQVNFPHNSKMESHAGSHHTTGKAQEDTSFPIEVRTEVGALAHLLIFFLPSKGTWAVSLGSFKTPRRQDYKKTKALVQLSGFQNFLVMDPVFCF